RVGAKDRALVERVVLDGDDHRPLEDQPSRAAAVEQPDRLGGEEDRQRAPGREEMERPLEEEEREVDLRGDAGRRAGELGATPPTGPAADFVPGADQPPERR